jgi:hypothetical protein
MKRAMVVVVPLVMSLGLTTRANADDRDTWQAVFAGAVTVTVGGLVTYVHGATKMSEARDELCHRGGYADDPSCATQTNLTYDELHRLNRKGERGETIAQIGMATTGVGVIVAGFAFYKGFIAKRESRVVVAPTVTRDSAGASVSLRW